jgi:hypothetical protein
MSDKFAAELVAQDFFAALVHRNWQGAARLVCPSVLESCAEGWKNRAVGLPGRSLEDRIRRQDPQMPSPVAEYLLERSRQFEREHGEWWRTELPGTESVDELLAAEPEQLMARFFASFDNPDDEESEPVEWKILGTVMDGPDTALVVYRPEGGRRRGDSGKVVELMAWASILRLRGDGEHWCVTDPHVAALRFPWAIAT